MKKFLYVVVLFYGVLIGAIPALIGFLVSPIIESFKAGLESFEIVEKELKKEYEK